MAKINLLPWRAELREQRKKEFLVVCAATFLLSLVLAGMIWMFYQNKLDDQLQANQMVSTANAELDRQLKTLDGLQKRRDQIIERMKVIQDLQGKRPVSVRVFDELARLIPANMYLTKLSRKDDKFTLEGRAESPNTVSELIRNLEASVWFRNAFMNSFTGAVVKPIDPSQSGGVAPRPEEGYGQFLVSVDLEEPPVVDPAQAASQAAVPAVVPVGGGPAAVPVAVTPVVTQQTTTTTTTTQVTTTPQQTMVVPSSTGAAK